MNQDDCSQLQFSWAACEDVAATASPPLIIRTCEHLLESGAFCQAAAVAGRSYCRAHVLLRGRCRKMARARRRARSLRLPSLMDQQSVRTGMVQVRVALAAGRIDAELARLLSYAMRQATSNLRFMEQQKRRALRQESTHIEPRSRDLSGAPPSWVSGRKDRGRSGASGITSRSQSRAERSISRGGKSKRHYRIRINFCESDSYNRNTS